MKKTKTRGGAVYRPKMARMATGQFQLHKDGNIFNSYTPRIDGLTIGGAIALGAVVDADTIGVVDPSMYTLAHEGETTGDLATQASDAIDALPEGAALPPVHPGEVLLEEFIRPHGLTPIRTATRMHVPRTRIERLVAGATAMTEDTALRLERLFGSSAEFWMELQLRHDLAMARASYDPSIAEIEPLTA